MSYFDWLVYYISPGRFQREQYTKLLLALYSTEFFWVLSRDKNRAEDGLELRNQFERETGEEVDIYGPCNCLELFVALAIRCENELMYDPDLGDRTDQWFWMFLDNLGLLAFDNYEFDESEIDDILYRFMARDYDKNGKYCAFPSMNYLTKLKRTELAYQMNYYMKEKFY